MNTDEKYINGGKRNKTGQNAELFDMLRGSDKLLEYIEREYAFDSARIRVLQQIFLGLGSMKKEEMENEIYLYGSLIKGDDLIARQMFLWLLGITESMNL